MSKKARALQSEVLPPEATADVPTEPEIAATGQEGAFAVASGPLEEIVGAPPESLTPEFELLPPLPNHFTAVYMPMGGTWCAYCSELSVTATGGDTLDDIRALLANAISRYFAANRRAAESIKVGSRQNAIIEPIRVAL